MVWLITFHGCQVWIPHFLLSWRAIVIHSGLHACSINNERRKHDPFQYPGQSVYCFCLCWQSIYIANKFVRQSRTEVLSLKIGLKENTLCPTPQFYLLTQEAEDYLVKTIFFGMLTTWELFGPKTEDLDLPDMEEQSQKRKIHNSTHSCSKLYSAGQYHSRIDNREYNVVGRKTDGSNKLQHNTIFPLLVFQYILI